jgi:hypothetical protein
MITVAFGRIECGCGRMAAMYQVGFWSMSIFFLMSAAKDTYVPTGNSYVGYVVCTIGDIFHFGYGLERLATYR